MVSVTKKKMLERRNFWMRIAFVAAIIFLASFVIWIIVFSTYQATHVSTYAANGTFQLYNPLRRLADWQIIGKDFPFFHGVGIPLLHYPIFSILGGGLFAAEIAKWIISPIFFLLSTFIFFYACFRNLQKTTIATSLFTMLAFFCIDVIWPGNSLIGLRGTLPVLIAAALLWKTERNIIFRDFKLPLNELVALLLLGISPIFSTEQGLAAIAGYAIVKLFIIHSTKESFQLKLKAVFYLALMGIFIITTSFLAYTAASSGNPFSALHYALVDIPQDQGWYFGADPIQFLQWSNIFSSVFTNAMRYMIGTIVLGFVAIYVLTKYTKQPHIKIVLGFMLAYSFVGLFTTIIGYYHPETQLIPLQRMMGLVIVLVAVKLVLGDRLWLKGVTSPKIAVVKTLIIVVSVSILTTLPLLGASSRISASREYDVTTNLKLSLRALQEDDYFAASSGWRSSLDSFRPYIDPDKKIWSTYTGLYDSYFGDQLSRSTGGEDYIIHALGDKRRDDYLHSFKNEKPDYAITLRPSYFVFEEWLWNRNWPFYEELFTNYTIIAKNDSNYLWVQNHNDIKTYDKNELFITNQSFRVPDNTTDKPVVYAIELQYKARASIPLTGKASRYLLTLDESQSQLYRISLPSDKNSLTFPVIVAPHTRGAVLAATAEGIMPFKSLELLSANYRLVDIDDKSLLPFVENICITKKLNQGFLAAEAYSSCVH